MEPYQFKIEDHVREPLFESLTLKQLYQLKGWIESEVNFELQIRLKNELPHT